MLPIAADPHLLEQAICEVLDNAVNSTRTVAALRCRDDRRRSMASCSCTIAGKAFRRSCYPSSPGPFSRNGNPEEIGGLGIGLALTHGIIEAHGGNITITSAGPGQGTTVTLSLPLTPENEPAGDK